MPVIYRLIAYNTQMLKSSKLQYPFSAIIGQDKLKKALLLSACDPALGGVLISGNRGTAKSTLARSLADLLDNQAFVNCPLGVTEDRLLGSLDVQQVLENSRLKFSPGLFSKAHQGVLYVDEINLLADHLVDLLLDVSASGVNYLERDGISHQHDAQFILIGSMNPEEGALRPQLLDRFGLYVEISENPNLDDRIEIVESRLAFEHDPVGFHKKYQERQNATKQLVRHATHILKHVKASTEMKREIAKRCLQAGVEGVRADLSLFRAARAHSAMRGSKSIIEEDIDAVTELVLAHRRQAPPQNSEKNKAVEQQESFNKNNDKPSSDKNDHVDNDNVQGDWGVMPTEEVTIGLTRQLDPKRFTSKNSQYRQEKKKH